MIITADIGGTNARMELHSLDGLKARVGPVFKKTYATQTVETFVTLILRFVSDSGHQVSQVSAAICGIPGDVVDNRVEAMNIRHWGIIDGEESAKEAGIESVFLLNDFECAAYSLNNFIPSDLNLLRAGTASGGPVKVIVGVGTGLGVAFATKTGKYYQPRPSESGWIPFWEITEFDRDLCKEFRKNLQSDTVSFEQVCAGPSLVNIYKYLVKKSSNEARFQNPKDICTNYSSCAFAREAVDIMIEYLGRFLSVLCLTYKPTGGLYLTGGTMDSLAPLIARSESLVKGLDSQKHPILLSISRAPSVHYIEKQDVGMHGAREFALVMKS